ncbi:MAG: repressor LexA [Bacteroidetes bacterium]|nr:repressor LexA [Bacteroidota bacterium]MCH8523355.1 repressor LexA [Balneolales bacterium]
MDNVQLTSKQKKFLDYIIEYKQDNEIWPTYREIADKFGFRSPNSVTQNLQSLLKKGYLIKTDENEYDLEPAFARKRGFSKKHRINEDEPTYGGIPIRGIISAGYLQEAVESNLGNITLQHLFPNLNKLFALRVAGQSMRDANINDGDFVLLVDEDIKDGDIGAVMYDGQTSLKRIYYGPEGLRLEPANEEYSDIHIEPDIFEEVRIIGKYVGHVNRNGIYKNAHQKAS